MPPHAGNAFHTAGYPVDSHLPWFGYLADPARDDIGAVRTYDNLFDLDHRWRRQACMDVTKLVYYMRTQDTWTSVVEEPMRSYHEKGQIPNGMDLTHMVPDKNTFDITKLSDQQRLDPTYDYLQILQDDMANGRLCEDYSVVWWKHMPKRHERTSGPRWEQGTDFPKGFFSNSVFWISKRLAWANHGRIRTL